MFQSPTNDIASALRGMTNPLPIVKYSGMTFARVSVGTAQNTRSTLVSYSANQLRTECREDEPLYLLEIGFTNQLIRSGDLTNAAWTLTNCTIVSSTEPAPDGTNTAFRLRVTASGAVASIAQVTGASNANACLTFWAKQGATSQQCSSNITPTSTDQNFTPTPGWSRVAHTKNAGVGAMTVTIRLHSSAGTGTANDEIILWGPQLTTTAVPMSYIGTGAGTVTKTAETLSAASGNWDTYLASRKWMITYCPNGSSTELNTVQVLTSFGGVNDELRINAVDQIEVVAGGVTIVTTSAITWDRQDKIRIYVDPPGGKVSIEGANTNNGTYSGTPWTWATGVTLRVAGRQGGTQETFGRLSEHFKW